MKYPQTLLLIILITFSISFQSFAIEKSKLKVYIFLSEKCPICQSSTLELNRILKKYPSELLQFEGIFPNLDLSNMESMAEFKRKYQLQFPLELDINLVLVKKFNATVTPQVFLVETQTEKIIYSGKIDNSYERVGKRRKVVNEHFLESAIENYYNQISISPVQTNPIGCYINL